MVSGRSLKRAPLRADGSPGSDLKKEKRHARWFLCGAKALRPPSHQPRVDLGAIGGLRRQRT